MIDVHCHLEQKDYDNDLDDVIRRAKEAGLKAIITCCANPADLDKSVEIVERYRGFVFLSASLHPIHVPDYSDEEAEAFMKKLESLKDIRVGIGETGLDYFWVKDEKERERQKEVFRMHIELARKLKLPLVVHSRESHDDVVSILDEYNYNRVLWHFFGVKDRVEWLVEHNYRASFNTLLFRSKTHKKIVKRLPIELILLETDAPWLGFGKRNEPSAIVRVAERIAEVRKMNFEEVWETCGRNAAEFFGLKIKI